MPVKRISPEEARDLMDKDGYVYVDVRSVPEFQAGHPAGAFNVPLIHMGPGGMAPNRDFLRVMEAHFSHDAKIVVGCKAGGRSIQAAQVLTGAGYTDVCDQRAGFDGAPDPHGGFEPGWRPQGLPVSNDAPADHSFEGLKAKLP